MIKPADLTLSPDLDRIRHDTVYSPIEVQAEKVRIKQQQLADNIIKVGDENIDFLKAEQIVLLTEEDRNWYVNKIKHLKDDADELVKIAKKVKNYNTADIVEDISIKIIAGLFDPIDPILDKFYDFSFGQFLIDTAHPETEEFKESVPRIFELSHDVSATTHEIKTWIKDLPYKDFSYQLDGKGYIFDENGKATSRILTGDQNKTMVSKNIIYGGVDAENTDNHQWALLTGDGKPIFNDQLLIPNLAHDPEKHNNNYLIVGIIIFSMLLYNNKI